MRLQSVLSPAQFGGVPSGEFVAGGEKHFVAEALQQRPPTLVAGKDGPQRADALGCNNRNETGLARQRKRALVACWVRFADRSKGMVLVTDKQLVPPDGIRLGCYLRNAIQDRALEIQLQHDADDASQSGIRGNRKVQCQNLAGIEKGVDRWQRHRLSWR